MTESKSTPDVQPPIAELAELVPAMGLTGYFADPFWPPLVAAELRRLAEHHAAVQAWRAVTHDSRPSRVMAMYGADLTAPGEQAANESDSRAAAKVTHAACDVPQPVEKKVAAGGFEPPTKGL